MKNLVLMGATGSVGVQALDAISRIPELQAQWRIFGLAAGGAHLELLAEQIRCHQPQIAVVRSAEQAVQLSERIGTWSGDILHGAAALAELAEHTDVQGVCVAIPGQQSFVPAWRALRAGKHLALASKEALVVGGQWLMACAAQNLWPVDSEHAALHQLLRGIHVPVRRAVMTASGGPFLRTPQSEWPEITPAAALQHPTWSMGPRISVDSATLMNKAFEWIEAQWLFGKRVRDFEVWIHPQSMVHGLIEHEDGSLWAQLGPRDMRHAIAYALGGERSPSWPWPRLRLEDLSRLEFLPVDEARFPALGLARQVWAQGGLWPAVLEAADALAVAAFLKGRLPFDRLVGCVAEVLQRFSMDLDAVPENVGAVAAEVELCFQNVWEHFNAKTR